MNSLNSVLLSILLIMCIVLVIFLIIISIKLLYTTDRVNVILEDVEKKIKSFNKVFKVVDGITDTLSNVSDFIVDKILSFISGLFSKNKKIKEEENE